MPTRCARISSLHGGPKTGKAPRSSRARARQPRQPAISAELASRLERVEAPGMHIVLNGGLHAVYHAERPRHRRVWHSEVVGQPALLLRPRATDGLAHLRHLPRPPDPARSVVCSTRRQRHHTALAKRGRRFPTLHRDLVVPPLARRGKRRLKRRRGEEAASMDASCTEVWLLGAPCCWNAVFGAAGLSAPPPGS